MWGRETSTICSTSQSVQKTISLLASVGVEPSYPCLGPFPVNDKLGYGVAVAMLLKSLEPGKYSDHQQFESIRKLQAGFNSVSISSVEEAFSLCSVGGDKAKHFLNICATHFTWFEHFAMGCLSCMGQEVWQDLAISLPLMHALMNNLESAWSLASDPTEKFLVASLGAYSVICFCGSFRIPEVLLVDLHGLRKYIDTPRRSDEISFVIIPLLGRMKNERGEKYHLTPLCSTTTSGLAIEMWVKQLMTCQAHYG